MAAISRAQMLKELLPGLNAIFGMSYKEVPELHKEIFKTEKSNRSFEEELKKSGMGAAPVKAEGAAAAVDTMQEAYSTRYTHETIALMFSITEEAVEDNLYDSMAKQGAKALGRAYAYTMQVKATNVLNNGFATNGGDGVPLFSNSHPTVGGGVNDNLLAAADISETALENAVIQMADWTDERGLLIASRPRKVIVSPTDQFAITRILRTELTTVNATQGATGITNQNAVNALKTNGIFPEGYVVDPWITDDDSYFILTDVPDGFKHFERAGIKRSMDTDLASGNMMYRIRGRYSFGYSDPLAALGSAGGA